MNKHFYHPPKPPICNPVVPCFVWDSLVATPTGEVRVQDIVPGMKVITRDNGIKEVTWAGKATAHGFYTVKGSNFSPNHRVLYIVDNDEVFIQAKLAPEAVYRDDPTTFVHFMLDMHEVVMVDGVWSESFFPGPYIMDNMEQEAADEIRYLFPDYSDWEMARKTLKKAEIPENLSDAHENVPLA